MAFRCSTRTTSRSRPDGDPLVAEEFRVSRRNRPAPARAEAQERRSQNLLNRAGDLADALLDQGRRLADVADGLTPFVENPDVPLQPLLTVAAGRSVVVTALVRRVLNRLVLRADTIGQGPLLAAEAIQTVDNLGALPRQIPEGCSESAQNLGVRVGAGLGLEVRDRQLHVSDRNAPLSHFGGQIGNVALDRKS